MTRPRVDARLYHPLVAKGKSTTAIRLGASKDNTLYQSGAGNYTWGSTPGMVADVQSWLDRPPSNFGWLLLGNELGIGTAKRFHSRENPAEVLRPVLTIEFTPPPPPSTDGELDRDGDVDDGDLNLLLSDFTSPASPQNHVDLNTLSSNFGRTDLGAAARGRLVPEPPASPMTSSASLPTPSGKPTSNTISPGSETFARARDSISLPRRRAFSAS